MKVLFFYVCILSLITSSCQELLFDDEEETREVLLNDFKALRVKGIYNILLIQDSTNKLIIKGKNSIRSIEATVVNDTLDIDNHRIFSIEPERNSLELHFTTLEYMYTHHPVNLETRDTIKADQFIYLAIGEIEEARISVNCNYLVIYGGHNTLGSIHLSGKSHFADLSVRYGASLDAQELLCTKAQVFNSSAGDIHVHATDEIDAYLNGSGNIYFHGNPRVNLVENTGSGKLISLQ